MPAFVGGVEVHRSLKVSQGEGNEFSSMISMFCAHYATMLSSLGRHFCFVMSCAGLKENG